MKKTLFLFLILSACNLSFGQKKIPSKVAKSPEKLSHYLTSGMNEENEKVEAIYKWITHNIEYNYKKTSSTKPLTYEGSQESLKDKKATCTGYSSLMKDMLNYVDIECEIVHGYSRTSLLDSVIAPIADDHAWVVVKIEEEWHLADPTWDAGYVGNMPTKKIAKYKKKWDKLNKKYDKKGSKKDGAALEKVKNKRKNAVKILRKKEYKAKDYTGKKGFVQNPGERWYLTDVDSFLVRHLPSMPMWQLKEDTVGVSTFANGDDSIYLFANNSNGGVIQFEDEIETFLKKDILQRSLYEGKIAHQFNPLNKHIIAQCNYNYVSAVTNKKLIEYLPDEHLFMDQSLLLPKIDTIMQFCKLAKTVSKSNFTYFKESYKNIKREDSDIHRGINKELTKLQSLNEKYYDKAKDSYEKLESQNESMYGKMGKLSYKNSKIKDKKEIIVLNGITDSINKRVNSIKQDLARWKAATENTFLQPILDSMLRNQHLMGVKNTYLENNSYGLNDYVREIDSSLSSNNKVLLSLYNDSLPIELLQKSIYSKVKELASYMKEVKSNLEELETSEKIKNADRTFKIYNKNLYKCYDELIDANNYAMSYNKWMNSILGNFKSYWKDIVSLSKKQDKLIDDRYEYVLDEIQTDYDRDVKMYEEMTSNCQKWKVKFKE